MTDRAKNSPESSPPEANDEPRRQPPKSSWSKVRENVEAVVIAIILALIIRHFSLEAFEIPTGSMAPGLYGVHVESECPNCGTASAIGIDTDPMSGKVLARLFQDSVVYEGSCPECGGRVEDNPQKEGVQVYCHGCSMYVDSQGEGFRRGRVGIIEPSCPLCTHQYKEIFDIGDCRKGHKILVNKFLYQLEEPQRWQVIVFKFNRQRNYIKRLVGLPGERIQVVDGDIHIDGEIERKPVWAQNQLWHPVHDSHNRERGHVKDAWWVGGKGWEVKPKLGEVTFNTLGEESTLRYQRAIYNSYAYNNAKVNRKRGDRVRDLRVQADIVVNAVASAGEGSLELEIVNEPYIYRCRIPVGSESGNTTFSSWRGEGGSGSSEEILEVVSDLRLEPRTPTNVDFYLADRTLVLRIDGEVRGRRELPPEDPGHYEYRKGKKTTVGLRARNIGGHVERLRVYRDIHYTWLGRHERVACEEPYQIPGAGVVFELAGGETVQGDIRAEEEGRVQIALRGSDGEALRWLERDEIVSAMALEGAYFAMGDNSPSSLDSRAWGFVPQQNMLGRAFAIFWPALPWRWQIGFIR